MPDYGFAFLTCYRDGPTGDQNLTTPKVVAIAKEAIMKVTPLGSKQKGGSIVHVLDPSNRQWKQYMVHENPAEVHAAINPAAADIHSKANIDLGVGATGTAQGDGYDVTKYLTEVTTATVTTAEALDIPAAAANKHLVIVNNTAVVLEVYPASADTINGAAVNIQYDLAANSRVHLVAIDAVDWVVADDATQS